MSALKRVEAWLPVEPSPDWHTLLSLTRANIADLRAVLALAKSAEELRRRVRLARAELDDDVSGFTHIRDLLDLCKPVARGRR